MSTRLSRPSSATSHSSRISHASHASHSSHASRTSQSGELKLECKAAYLTVLDDVHDELTSKQDFILALQQAGRNPTQKMVRKYWDNDREAMSFDEFVDVCRKEPPTSEDDLMKAFRKIDINGDGYISLDELYKIMTTKGEKMSRQEVKAMIDEVDENKDGKLDYREFCHMFISTAEECKKMSLKVMEKKERRKKRGDAPTAPPRKDEGSVNGSQLSIRSAASEKTKGNEKDEEENPEENDGDAEKEKETEEKDEAPLDAKESTEPKLGSRLSLQSQRSKRSKPSPV
ncbi:hypothetical protein BaRGS_00015855 [Batillaria attramentaria]|uniref:EF-hand domain-containing protein n=1 Tax=Batillaria attramentaria TaxID=370345 RepID=A0ABD0L070_9CAEN